MLLHPQGGEKNCRRNLQEKNVSAPTQHSKCTPRQSKSQFLEHFLLCGEDLELQLVSLDRLLKTTTKKVVNFLEQNVHPRQNPGYAYAESPWNQSDRKEKKVYGAEDLPKSQVLSSE